MHARSFDEFLLTDSVSDMSAPRIIDNDRVELATTLRQVAKDHAYLSIATGYWDLPGTQEILDEIRGYEKIRLLIGQEPLIPRHANVLKVSSPEPSFPDQDFSYDLANLTDDSLRETLQDLKTLIAEGRLEVRLYRRSFLHAKAYIFGDYLSTQAVGIIGSSNFTRAGLTSNSELNSLEPNYQIVKFRPIAETDQHGHLSWFDSLWNDDQTVIWDGRFSEILGDSPIGDVVFGPYDTYIKTLMEVYPDELVPKADLSQESQDVLYWFQHRNAQILINKLERMGLAMLSDSVGLGKTVTAGAVINHYREANASRIYVIAPASLKQQWKDDLGNHFGLTQEFEVISLQDAQAIEAARKLDRYKKVDLFVIDEAHNLRNENSRRYLQLQDWFIDNPDSKVLLLTATPINNTLMDFVSQIQLASKGQLDSINVDYRDEKNRVQKIDFFEALKRIQSRISRAEKEGKEFDWSSTREIIASGLRHYLVRSTRQGIKDAGGIKLSDGSSRDFPESKVEQIGYQYSETSRAQVEEVIQNALAAFEGHDPRSLDIESLLELTQRSSHPLDLVGQGLVPKVDIHVGNVFLSIFQIVLLLGFAPYKPDIYAHNILGKSIDEIRSLGLQGDESLKIQSQLSIHNMLRITLLKRIESSQGAFKKSLENYRARIDLFETALNRGLILTFKELDSIVSEYGEDVDSAISTFLEENGVSKQADPNLFDLAALRRDIERDKKLVTTLVAISDSLAQSDDKLSAFAKKLVEIQTDPNLAAKKVLVFSYFADTIRYLEKSLPALIKDQSFLERSAYVTGGTSSVETVVGRFSPRSKKYVMLASETPIDFLFATDVLSEGQNLQDAGTLINFDLHWNPVRMIQRNGRINRLGSEFEEVFVFNMKPEDSLETYLKLLRRLERKISTIKHTIGTDQNITAEGQLSPREYTENLTAVEGLINDLALSEMGSGTSEEGREFDTARLYGDLSGEALKELEAEEDEFYVEDQFVYELRNFLTVNEAQPEEIERIRSIPQGKWGYLPTRTSPSSPDFVLGLARVNGSTSITGVEISETQFVKVEPWGEFRASAIEDLTALKLLRTIPTDNERLQDRINVDRSKVKKRTYSISRTQTRSEKAKFILKPSELETLRKFEELLPGRNLARLISIQISNKRELKSAQRILREARKQLRLDGQILPNMIREMDFFSQELGKKVNEVTLVSGIETVLFYAKK